MDEKASSTGTSLMHQGAIKNSTNIEAALKRDQPKHLSLVHDPNSKWAILTKQAHRIYHYRLTQHNLSTQDKEALMLARNELLALAKSLKATSAVQNIINVD